MNTGQRLDNYYAQRSILTSPMNRRLKHKLGHEMRKRLIELARKQAEREDTE